MKKIKPEKIIVIWYALTGSPRITGKSVAVCYSKLLFAHLTAGFTHSASGL